MFHKMFTYIFVNPCTIVQSTKLITQLANMCVSVVPDMCSSAHIVFCFACSHLSGLVYEICGYSSFLLVIIVVV